MANHVETISAIYEAFGKGDIPGILEHLDDNVRWEQWKDNSAQKAGVPWLQERIGKREVPEFFNSLARVQFREFRILSIMAGDNHVAAEIEVDVYMPDNDTHLRDEEIHLWTFNDQGKVVRMRHYTDTAKHIAAAQQ